MPVLVLLIGSQKSQHEALASYWPCGVVLSDFGIVDKSLVVCLPSSGYDGSLDVSVNIFGFFITTLL